MLSFTKHQQIAIICVIVVVILSVIALIGIYGPVLFYSAMQGHRCTSLPCSYIKNDNFTFVFRLENGTIEEWYFPTKRVRSLPDCTQGHAYGLA